MVTVSAQSHASIKITDLSKDITDDIYAKHIGWKITEVYSDSTNNVKNYEIIIERGTNKMHLFYDTDGYYVRGIDQKTLDRQAAKSSAVNTTNIKK
jgi:hypothetical protein